MKYMKININDINININDRKYVNKDNVISGNIEANIQYNESHQ